MNRLGANLTKWGAIALALLLVFWVDSQLASQGHLLAVVLVSMLGLAILAVYGTRRAVPLKYLFPGLLLLLGLQVWPQVYTAVTAFTNYGDGHSISKQEAVADIIANSVREVPGTSRYKLSVAVKEGTDPATGPAYYLLTDPQGRTFVGDDKGLSDLPEAAVEKSPAGKILRADGYQVLSGIQVNARDDLKSFAVPTRDGGGIKAVGLSEAFEGRASVSYDPRTDTLTDSTTGKRYVARAARWVPQDGQGEPFPQGWKENVGFKNFSSALTDPVLRAGFVKILVWNIVFALASVVGNFLLGMLLALLLNDPRLRGRGVYRSLMILPYAIPGFVTALVWRSMFNQDYGLINNTLHLDVDWLGNPWAARFAILLANLWLGFPYMFIVCTGALQSIPADVKEAARIDGASPFRMLRSIIMPLLLVAVGPLLLAAFAFNFNNFTLIYLLTEGGPFEAANTQIGSTDLLITYAFRLAFSGVSPNYGFAAAVSIFIFVIVALISVQGLRRTKALEEVN
jgi:arabinogalactan oligomer / maltooligosaccharide transport system permease protein